MLNDEVNKLTNNIVEEEKEEDEVVSLNVETHIEDSYVSDDDLKIEIHKIINRIDSFESLELAKNELEDRVTCPIIVVEKPKDQIEYHSYCYHFYEYKNERLEEIIKSNKGGAKASQNAFKILSIIIDEKNKEMIKKILIKDENIFKQLEIYCNQMDD